MSTESVIHSLEHLAKHSNVHVVQVECGQAATTLRELADRVAEQDKIIERGQAQIDDLYDSVIDVFSEHDDNSTVEQVRVALYSMLGITTGR